jgi:hypothetical protein
MAADDELKKLLISGIEKNGGVRLPTSSSKPSAPTLAADLNQARKLFGEKQTLAAAIVLSKHVQSSAGTSEEIAEIVKLTGLSVARSETEKQLGLLVKEVSEAGQALVKAAVEAAGSGKPTQGAVRLAELERVFGRFPSFAGTFEAAWKEVEGKSPVPLLQEQAQLIDTARQAEGQAEPAQAIKVYERVATTYPYTEAAAISHRRIAELRNAKRAQPRVWTSKNGNFSVTAVLVSFDGTTVKLRSSEGKDIAVPVAALSAEDQALLKADKGQN